MTIDIKKLGIHPEPSGVTTRDGRMVAIYSADPQAPFPIWGNIIEDGEPDWRQRHYWNTDGTADRRRVSGLDLVEHGSAEISAVDAVNRRKFTKTYYTVVCEKFISDLAHEVDNNFGLGWSLVGGVSIAFDSQGQIHYCQAMTRTEEIEP